MMFNTIAIIIVIGCLIEILVRIRTRNDSVLNYNIVHRAPNAVFKQTCNYSIKKIQCSNHDHFLNQDYTLRVQIKMIINHQSNIIITNLIGIERGHHPDRRCHNKFN